MPRMSTSVDHDDSRSSVFSEGAMEVEEEQVPVKKSAGRPKKGKVDTPPANDDDEEDEQEEGDEEEGSEEEDEDVYIVEAIINHRFEDGTLKFHVRWKDYPKLKDHTWESEDVLESAIDVVNEYIDGVGGREALAKAPKAGGKKRGRKSTNGADTPASVPGSQQKNGKRARKLESEDPKQEESPGPSQPKLPPGNWEDLISTIDTMERQVGGLYILLTFKNGQRIKQPASVVYKRCPQRMLQFYESHLSIKAPLGGETD